MKKLIIGLFSAALMGGGLVGISAESATAACPYTGCVDTFTTVNAPNQVTKGNTATICVKVTTGGSGRPEGRVSIEVERSGGGYHFADARRYDGARECFTTTTLKKRGDYKVRAHFNGFQSAGFRDSGDSAAFRVVRRG